MTDLVHKLRSEVHASEHHMLASGFGKGIYHARRGVIGRKIHEASFGQIYAAQSITVFLHGRGCMVREHGDVFLLLLFIFVHTIFLDGDRQ